MTYRVFQMNNLEATKLFLTCSIVITFEFHIQIILPSIKFGKKLFNQATLRERAAITVAHNSQLSGRSPIFIAQIILRAVR